MATRGPPPRESGCLAASPPREVPRTHSLTGLRAWGAGFLEGIRASCGPRQPMKWRTVWRMTRLGWPPLI